MGKMKKPAGTQKRDPHQKKISKKHSPHQKKTKKSTLKDTIGKNQENTVPQVEKECKISGNVHGKWKAISESTQQYTRHVLESHCSLTLNRLPVDIHEEVSDALAELKHVYSGALAKSTVPTPVCKDYAELKRQCQIWKKESEANLSQIGKMEKEMQRLENQTEKNEGEIIDLKKAMGQSTVDKG